MKINEESLKEMQATIKHSKIHAMVVSERQGKIRGEEGNKQRGELGKGEGEAQ